MVASETCAFDLIGAEFVRSVEPGELLIITDEGVKSIVLQRWINVPCVQWSMFI